MKFVINYLNTLNEEKIIDAYLRSYSINYKKVKDMFSLEGAEAEAFVRKEISDYIRRLKNTAYSLRDNGDVGMLFYVPYETHKTVFAMLREFSDLGNSAPRYNNSYSSEEELLGFLISDDQDTQNNIYDLIADVIHEATWFCFNSGELAEELAALKEKLEREADEWVGTGGYPPTRKRVAAGLIEDDFEPLDPEKDLSFAAVLNESEDEEDLGKYF